jgi:alkylation response protein AidB-like acyl-CoA dehydrogenase
MTALSISAASDIPVIDTDIVARATELVPLIREYAEQGNDARRLAPEIVKALDEAGLFRTLLPTRLGGLGTTVRTAIEVMKEVSRGDGSAGWVTTLLTVGIGFTTTYSEQAQLEVFADNPSAKVSGTFSPGSRSERVDGGYRISGRWPYSSGSFIADWATLGILLEDGAPGLALVPAEAWTIEPTWFVAGMKGTGSDTIVIEDHFVPDHRVQRFFDMNATNFATPYKDELMAGMPLNAIASAILAAPQVGLARHALEVTRAKLPERAVAYTSYDKAKNSPTHQLCVAKAATYVNMAELLLDQMTVEIDRAAITKAPLDPETRARIRNDTGVIAELVGQAIDTLMTANGAGSFADVNVLNRIWRDSNIGARHAFVSAELGKEAYGRALLGVDEQAILL